MNKKDELLKKLTKACIKKEELEQSKINAENSEERNRKNILWTNVFTFIVYLLGYFTFPPIVAAALIYNVINMIVRSVLMYKASDQKEECDRLIKECDELISSYQNELENIKEYSNDLTNEPLPLKSTKQNNSNQKKGR